jgi:hypothetical protein
MPILEPSHRTSNSHILFNYVYLQRILYKCSQVTWVVGRMLCNVIRIHRIQLLLLRNLTATFVCLCKLLFITKKRSVAYVPSLFFFCVPTQETGGTVGELFAAASSSASQSSFEARTGSKLAGSACTWLAAGVFAWCSCHAQTTDPSAST